MIAIFFYVIYYIKLLRKREDKFSHKSLLLYIYIYNKESLEPLIILAIII